MHESYRSCHWPDGINGCASPSISFDASWVFPFSARASRDSPVTWSTLHCRPAVAKELGVPIIMHDYITGGFTANTSLANYCRDHGLLLHIHRAMHVVVDRQKIHGIHFRVLAKCLRMSGGDHLHSGTVVGKLEGDRAITLGFVDLMRDETVQQDRSRGVYFYDDHRPVKRILVMSSIFTLAFLSVVLSYAMHLVVVL